MKKHTFKSDTDKRARSVFLSFCKPVTLLALALIFASPLASAQPLIDFSKSFAPDTIGPGSISTLTFTIDSQSGDAVTQLNFTDVLPAEVTIAGFANSSSSCKGTLTAPAGGNTISLAGGSLVKGGTCTISVDVTSTAEGMHTNVSGDLTSNLGNSGPAQADLYVDFGRPGFSKEFTPSQVLYGERTVLTFTIDNTQNPNVASGLSFNDRLPTGLMIASPSNSSTDCGNDILPTTLTAEPGTDLISYSYLGINAFPVVPANASCQVSVDVVALAVGDLGNASDQLIDISQNTQIVSMGSANATLQVFADPVQLVKSFLDDPVVPGTGVTLEFTILNRSRTETASNISFSDDLDATLSGLVAVGLPKADVCGAGSQISGTGLVTLAGGTLDPAQNCTFSIDLMVPAAASSGAYTNKASKVTSNGVSDPGPVNPITGYGASDTLFVAPVPLITKTFIDDPVAAGDTATIEFTITNSSNDFTATDIGFSDVFDVVLQTAVSIPANDSCGAGSFFQFIPITGNSLAELIMTGGTLPPGGSCTFSIELDVYPTASSGGYQNLTSAITATVGEQTVTGQPANDQLEIVGGPLLYKQFLDIPVASPGTATLEFTVSNDANGQLDQDVFDDFTNIAFTDDLGAVLPGLVATGLPLSDVCGAGSTLSGTSLLTLAGGSLPMGTDCTFQVQVEIPANTTPGSYTNTSSAVTATARGLGVTGNSATAEIDVAGLILSKQFTDDPVLAGDTVILDFTIENVTPDLDATSISFTDSLDNTLSGLTATGLPMTDVCGAGSSLTGAGDSFMILTGGNLLAGESCTFSVTLQVPANAIDGAYTNRTSDMSATMGGNTIVFAGALDSLIVGTGEESIPQATVSVSKTFSDGNPAEVDINLVCSSGDITVLDGTAGNGDTADFIIDGFTSPANCTATEPNGTNGYTTNADACFELAIAADTNSACAVTNTQDPLTVTVYKTYTEVHPIADSQVEITLTCPSGTVDGGTNSNTTTTSGTGNDRKAEFLVSGFPFGGEDCIATENIPAGYEFVSAPGCDALTVVPGGATPVCTITNRPQTALLTVDKIYSDGNPELAVDVTANCTDQGGGPGIAYNPSASGQALQDTDFTTTVKYFAGATNCTVSEQVPVGYTLLEGSSTCIAGVPITDVADGTCTLFNDQDPITILASKEYEGNEGPAAEFAASCSDGDVAAIKVSASVGSPAEFELSNFPWNGTTCDITEPVPPAGFSVLSSTCNDLGIAPGDDDTLCTITNGQFQNIPTLSQWGTAILLFLMLGAGMIGFRRFTYMP